MSTSHHTRAPSVQTGLSVVELLVALAIASVMMAYAIPAFNDFTSQRRMTANVNLIVSAVNYARNDAARTGRDVSVQAMDPENDNEWGGGFCVVAGDDGNCDDPFTVFRPEGNGITIDSQGVLDGVETWTFNSKGLPDNAIGGTDAADGVWLCGEDEDDDPGRVVRMSAIGRVNIEQFTCYP